MNFESKLVYTAGSVVPVSANEVTVMFSILHVVYCVFYSDNKLCNVYMLKEGGKKSNLDVYYDNLDIYTKKKEKKKGKKSNLDVLIFGQIYEDKWAHVLIFGQHYEGKKAPPGGGRSYFRTFLLSAFDCMV
jgi:hypothetical protein